MSISSGNSRKLYWRLFVATIIASFSFPIRFAFFPETYAKLNFVQEVIVFCLEVIGIAWILRRRFGDDEDQNDRE